jgi:hypothetical protein
MGDTAASEPSGPTRTGGLNTRTPDAVTVSLAVAAQD